MYSVYKMLRFSRYTLYSLLVLILGIFFSAGMIHPPVEEPSFPMLFTLLSLFILLLCLWMQTCSYALSEEDFTIDQGGRHIRVKLSDIVEINVKNFLGGKFLEIESLRGKFIIPLSSITDHTTFLRVMSRRVSKNTGDEGREELDLDD